MDLQLGICTVSQMANRLKLSRARFYQLIDAGIFPPPAYCIVTKKPLYPERLQVICCQVRRSGVGFNGHLVRFYSPRRKKKSSDQHKHVVDILRQMGLKVSIAQVSEALRKLKISASSVKSLNKDSIRRLFVFLHSDCLEGV